MRTRNTWGIAAVAIVVATLLVPAASAHAQGAQPLYDAIPASMPGNVPSLGYEATQTDEFGDRVVLAHAGWILDSARVTMSSWGCESGGWPASNCVTTPGATFDHPLTLNIYAVNAATGEPGALLATKTQTFAIPYRPSTDSTNCTNGRWYDGTACYSGLATTVEWDMSDLDVTLPERVVWAVAYNTSHHGNSPIGEAAACYTESGGCGYDSLNVGAQTFALGAGQDDLPDGAVWDTSTAGWYCDGGAGGTDTLRVDSCAGAWTTNRPMGEILARNPLVGGVAAGAIGAQSERMVRPREGAAWLPWALGLAGVAAVALVVVRRRRS